MPEVKDAMPRRLALRLRVGASTASAVGRMCAPLSSGTRLGKRRKSYQAAVATVATLVVTVGPGDSFAATYKRCGHMIDVRAGDIVAKGVSCRSARAVTRAYAGRRAQIRDFECEQYRDPQGRYETFLVRCRNGLKRVRFGMSL